MSGWLAAAFVGTPFAFIAARAAAAAVIRHYVGKALRARDARR